ncbi:DUF5995 family protein [Calothrix sp. 336/3]|uniref:DUF5995 family protein n=1 Tax=Calothrix sp. 336/3 TaxID=1337936 RepID=UPI0004E3B4F8|nr:DUF5995 family protein [Calothrix sp. 336/3]AKG20508.1 hypothetical protein IJ00_03540 [Calothrix sp. 336/3]
MQAKNTEQVMRHLEDIIAEAKRNCDRTGLFAALYRQVTLKINQGIESHLFEDNSRMERFATKFANRYFQALDDYQKHGKPTKSWKVALEATTHPDYLVLQHLLLGINAHINLDLGIVAAQINPDSKLPTFRQDYDTVNHIIGELLDGVQGIVGKFSPLLDILDKLGGKTDEWLMTFSMTKARQEAWNLAELLAGQNFVVQQGIIAMIDTKVAFLGKLLINPSRTLNKAVDLIHETESDDIPAIIDALNSIVNS